MGRPPGYRPDGSVPIGGFYFYIRASRSDSLFLKLTPKGGRGAPDELRGGKYCMSRGSGLGFDPSDQRSKLRSVTLARIRNGSSLELCSHRHRNAVREVAVFHVGFNSMAVDFS